MTAVNVSGLLFIHYFVFSNTEVVHDFIGLSVKSATAFAYTYVIYA